MRLVRIVPVLLLAATAGALAQSAAAPRPPGLDTVVARTAAYIRSLETRMATIVATEQYRQTLERWPAGGLPLGRGARVQTRALLSDYALVRSTDRNEWVGFRDTFEVDGRPVRDHDGRLEQLVSTGALAAAARVVRESARFNLANDTFPRTVNVPTLVLHLLQSSNRRRFSFRKTGEQEIDGVSTWQIDYRERDRPTIVKDASGRDQPSNGSIWVVPETGEIRRTLVEWPTKNPRGGEQHRLPLGQIVVTWAHAPGIDTLVPVEMREQYARGAAALDGVATYTNFRQFTTDARIVAP